MREDDRALPLGEHRSRPAVGSTIGKPRAHSSGGYSSVRIAAERSATGSIDMLPANDLHEDEVVEPASRMTTMCLHRGVAGGLLLIGLMTILLGLAIVVTSVTRKCE